MTKTSMNTNGNRRWFQIIGSLLLLVALAIGMISIHARGQSPLQPFKIQLNQMCDGVLKLRTEFNSNLIDSQQLLDQIKPLIVAGYANIKPKQLGNQVINSDVSALVLPLLASKLLNEQVDACVVFKKKGI